MAAVARTPVTDHEPGALRPCTSTAVLPSERLAPGLIQLLLRTRAPNSPLIAETSVATNWPVSATIGERRRSAQVDGTGGDGRVALAAIEIDDSKRLEPDTILTALAALRTV